MSSKQETYLEKLSNPEDVGPGIWFTIHVRAMKAKTDEQKKEFAIYVRMICSEMRCLNCRGHCQEYIRLNPIEDYWNVKDINGQDVGMFKWSWVFHNAVNTRIGKANVDWNTAYQMFADDSGICAADCGAPDVKANASSAVIQTKTNTSTASKGPRPPLVTTNKKNRSFHMVN